MILYLVIGQLVIVAARKKCDEKLPSTCDEAVFSAPGKAVMFNVGGAAWLDGFDVLPTITKTNNWEECKKLCLLDSWCFTFQREEKSGNCTVFYGTTIDLVQKMDESDGYTFGWRVKFQTTDKIDCLNPNISMLFDYNFVLPNRQPNVIVHNKHKFYYNKYYRQTDFELTCMMNWSLANYAFWCFKSFFWPGIKMKHAEEVCEAMDGGLQPVTDIWLVENYIYGYTRTVDKTSRYLWTGSKVKFPKNGNATLYAFNPKFTYNVTVDDNIPKWLDGYPIKDRNKKCTMMFSKPPNSSEPYQYGHLMNVNCNDSRNITGFICGVPNYDYDFSVTRYSRANQTYITL